MACRTFPARPPSSCFALAATTFTSPRLVRAHAPRRGSAGTGAGVSPTAAAPLWPRLTLSLPDAFFCPAHRRPRATSTPTACTLERRSPTCCTPSTPRAARHRTRPSTSRRFTALSCTRQVRVRSWGQGEGGQDREGRCSLGSARALAHAALSLATFSLRRDEQAAGYGEEHGVAGASDAHGRAAHVSSGTLFDRSVVAPDGTVSLFFSFYFLPFYDYPDKTSQSL